MHSCRLKDRRKLRIEFFPFTMWGCWKELKLSVLAVCTPIKISVSKTFKTVSLAEVS